MPRRRPEPPLDPFERAARRSDPDYARLAEAAEAAPPSALRAPRLLLYFVVLVVAAAVAKGGHGGGGLKRSCTTPGLAVASTTLTLDSQLRWTVTGPEKDSVVLALDGTPETRPTALTGCLVHGSFPIQARAGKHTLTATVTAPDGSTVAHLTKTLTVH